MTSESSKRSSSEQEPGDKQQTSTNSRDHIMPVKEEPVKRTWMQRLYARVPPYQLTRIIVKASISILIALLFVFVDSLRNAIGSASVLVPIAALLYFPFRPIGKTFIIHHINKKRKNKLTVLFRYSIGSKIDVLNHFVPHKRAKASFICDPRLLFMVCLALWWVLLGVFWVQINKVALDENLPFSFSTGMYCASLARDPSVTSPVQPGSSGVLAVFMLIGLFIVSYLRVKFVQGECVIVCQQDDAKEKEIAICGTTFASMIVAFGLTQAAITPTFQPIVIVRQVH